MLTRLRWIAAACALFASVLLLGACGPLATREDPTPTVVPARADEGKQVYVVQRGSIFDTIKGLGRISSRVETPLYFKNSGRLKSVDVEVLQPVKEGDLLAELDMGDLPARMETARIQMEIAQIELAREVAARGAAVRSDVQQAASAVVSSQAAATRAANELAKMEAGASAADFAAAEAAASAARATLERARVQLATLNRPGREEEVIVARSALERARIALETAQANYDRIGWRPDAARTPQAIALQQATADHQAAEANYRLATAGPRTEELAAAEQAVRSAEEGLRSADARLAQVRAGPRPDEVIALRTAAERAEFALNEARAAFEAVSASARVDAADYELAMAEKRVDLARVRYEALVNELEMARIRAPFEGVITFVTGQRGQRFEAFDPIAIISDPTKLEVAVEFGSAEMGRIAPAQQATVMTEAFGREELQGKVVRVPGFDSGLPGSGPLSTTVPRQVRISFDPPGPDAQLGQLANVTVITQQKDDILLIPNTAVRRFGPRRYVQALTDDGRRIDVDIDVGLVTETDSEVTKGLREGQQVIVG